METKLLDGAKLAKKINEQTKKEIKNFPLKPHLVAIQVGNYPESNIYLEHKKRVAEEVGIKFSLEKFSEKITLSKLLNKILKLNKDSKVDGIMVQLPLPNHIDAKIVSQSIIPWKDVDGFHPLNKGLLDLNQAQLVPPTAFGVMELLNEYKIEVNGLHAVIIGTGEISGKPLSKLLLNSGATITMCNKNTKNIESHIKQADILVVAVGHKYLIKDHNLIKKGAIIINIGVTKIENKVYGDIDFDKISIKASYITPIIGGTGPMTVALLLRNTLICKKMK